MYAAAARPCPSAAVAVDDDEMKMKLCDKDAAAAAAAGVNLDHVHGCAAATPLMRSWLLTAVYRRRATTTPIYHADVQLQPGVTRSFSRVVRLLPF